MNNFESFSEDLVPRNAPRPIVDQFYQNLAAPTVPELSFLIPEKQKDEVDQPKKPLSYSDWKKQQDALRLKAPNPNNNRPQLVPPAPKNVVFPSEFKQFVPVESAQQPSNLNNNFHNANRNAQPVNGEVPTSNNCTAANEPTLAEIYDLIKQQQIKQVDKPKPTVEPSIRDLYQLLLKTNESGKTVEKSNPEQCNPIELDIRDELQKQQKQIDNLQSQVNQLLKTVSDLKEENRKHLTKPSNVSIGIMTNGDDEPEEHDPQTNSPKNDNEAVQPVGWTFYGNILGQVNDVLQNSSSNAQLNNSKDAITINNNGPINNNKYCKTPVEQNNLVFEQNYKQLQYENYLLTQQIKEHQKLHQPQPHLNGINFTGVNVSATKRVTFGQMPSSTMTTTQQQHQITTEIQTHHRHATDRSLAMNTLALRYLPKDQLSNLINQNAIFFPSGQFETTNGASYPAAGAAVVHNDNNLQPFLFDRQNWSNFTGNTPYNTSS